MKYEIVKFNKTTVYGKSLITTNAENRFGEVWEEYLSSEVPSGRLFGAYSAYENGAAGRFQFTVGAETGACEKKVLEIPEGNYIKISLKDRSQIADAWSFIWSSDIDRRFDVDFEVYNADGSVDVYLSANLHLTPCGIDCRTCRDYEKGCRGCRMEKGVVSWIGYTDFKACPEYTCPVDEKGHWDCGSCDKLPCNHYFDLKDPSISDEDHNISVKNRTDLLKSRKR